MTVTDIENINKKKRRIFIDGKKAFVLYVGEVNKYNIKVGKEIDESMFNFIMYDVLKKRARLRVLHILEKRDKTKKQLIDKLFENEYPEEIIYDAINYAESYNYINDKEYSKRYVRYRINMKSKRLLISHLINRGVDKETAILAYEEVYEEISEEYDCADECSSDAGMYSIEERQIKQIIDKRLPKENATIKDKQRVYRYLVSKGFSSSDICKFLI